MEDPNLKEIDNQLHELKTQIVIRRSIVIRCGFHFAGALLSIVRRSIVIHCPSWVQNSIAVSYHHSKEKMVMRNDFKQWFENCHPRQSHCRLTPPLPESLPNQIAFSFQIAFLFQIRLARPQLPGQSSPPPSSVRSPDHLHSAKLDNPNLGLEFREKSKVA